MNRDIIREIAEVKSRSEEAHGAQAVVFTLREEWRRRSSDLPSLLTDVYPIRLVTALEVFMRTRITWLIDFSDKFADKAPSLLKGLKVELGFVRAVAGKTVSFGELVAHQLPMSTFDHLLAPLKTLLGEDPRGVLEKQPGVKYPDEGIEYGEPLIQDYDGMAKRLSRLFEVRHILCHEIPTSPVYSVEEIDGFITAVEEFMSAVQGATYLHAYGRLTPLTRADMVEVAEQELSDYELQLAELMKAIEQTVNSDEGLIEYERSGLGPTRAEALSLLHDSQEKWRASRNAMCEVDSYGWILGSGGALIWLARASALTRKRLDDLRLTLRARTWSS